MKQNSEDILLTAICTKRTLFYDNIINGYGLGGKVQWVTYREQGQTKSQVLQTYFANKPKKYWIVHGKNYYVNAFDLGNMITTLELIKSAYCIGIVPYTEYHISGPREKPTSAQRVTIYHVERCKNELAKCDANEEWYITLGKRMVAQGFQPVIANKARLFRLEQQPHASELT